MSVYKSPFEGEPATAEARDEAGNACFKITCKTITPFRERIVDSLTSVVDYGLWGMGVLGLIQSRDPSVLIFLGGISLIGRRWYRRWIAEEFITSTTIMISEGAIAVQRGMFSGTETFDRHQVHRFALLQHDKAQDEQREHEHGQREDQSRREVELRKPYYQDSFFVVLEYLGQRHDLIEVYGRKDAMAILARLKACDEMAEAQTRQGQGLATRPQDEWGPQPGDIPDTV